MRINWLHERFKEPWHNLKWCNTEAQAADIFTKPFVDVGKWNHNLALIHVVDPRQCWSINPIYSQSPEAHIESKKQKAKRRAAEKAAQVEGKILLPDDAIVTPTAKQEEWWIRFEKKKRLDGSFARKMNNTFTHTLLKTTLSKVLNLVFRHIFHKDYTEHKSEIDLA